MIQEMLKAHKDTIGFEFDIDKQLIADIGNSLNIILKRRYRRWSYSEPSLHIKFNDEMELESVRCYVWEFLGSSMIHLYGVEYERGNFKYHKFTSDIYNFLETGADQELYNYNKTVDKLNDIILTKIKSFITKDTLYKKIFKKEKQLNELRKKVLADFNSRLQKNNVLKKTVVKINKIFNKNTSEIYFKHLSHKYNGMEIGLYGECDSYIDTGLCSITRTDYYIGTLIFEDGKYKFEPNLRNQKFITNEVSSMRFLKQTLKKHLLKG